MRIPSSIAAVLFASATGCLLVVGSDGISDGPAPSVDAGSGPPTVRDAQSPTDDGPTLEASTPENDGSIPEILKLMTFEKGVVLDPETGADRAEGPGRVDLEDLFALNGKYSARIAASASGPTVAAALSETFPSVAEVFVSFLIRVDSYPTEDTRLFWIGKAEGRVDGAFLLTAEGRLKSEQESSVLERNTVYRVGYHNKTGRAEMFLSLASAALFGTAFATTATHGSGGFSRIDLGQTEAKGGFAILLDDVRISRVSF